MGRLENRLQEYFDLPNVDRSGLVAKVANQGIKLKDLDRTLTNFEGERERYLQAFWEENLSDEDDEILLPETRTFMEGDALDEGHFPELYTSSDVSERAVNYGYVLNASLYQKIFQSYPEADQSDRLLLNRGRDVLRFFLESFPEIRNDDTLLSFVGEYFSKKNISFQEMQAIDDYFSPRFDTSEYLSFLERIDEEYGLSGNVSPVGSRQMAALSEIAKDSHLRERFIEGVRERSYLQHFDRTDLGGLLKYMGTDEVDSEELSPVDSLGLKGRIYNDHASRIDKIEEEGVSFQPFMTLTAPEMVYQAVEVLRTHPKIKGKQLYQSVMKELHDVADLDLRRIDMDATRIYSDEIARVIEPFLKEDRNRTHFPGLQEHLQEAFYSGDVSFRLASRDDDDRTLGDKTGDCTQKDGQNSQYVEAWVQDPFTQFLKEYYQGKFIGRKNVVLGIANESPALLIDAVEYIPQARENDKYDGFAREAFSAGLSRIERMADEMNVPQIFAYTFSNSNDLPELVSELGYSEERIAFKLFRPDSTHSYFLQSEDQSAHDYDADTLREFEHYMNDTYLTDGGRSIQLARMIDEDRLEEAAEQICTFSFETGTAPKSFGSIETIEDQLRSLYVENKTVSAGGERIVTAFRIK